MTAAAAYERHWQKQGKKETKRECGENYTVLLPSGGREIERNKGEWENARGKVERSQSRTLKRGFFFKSLSFRL